MTVENSIGRKVARKPSVTPKRAIRVVAISGLALAGAVAAAALPGWINTANKVFYPVDQGTSPEPQEKGPLMGVFRVFITTSPVRIMVELPGESSDSGKEIKAMGDLLATVASKEAEKAGISEPVLFYGRSTGNPRSPQFEGCYVFQDYNGVTKIYFCPAKSLNEDSDWQMALSEFGPTGEAREYDVTNPETMKPGRVGVIDENLPDLDSPEIH